MNVFKMKISDLKFDRPFITNKVHKKKEFFYDFRKTGYVHYYYKNRLFRVKKYPIGFSYSNISFEVRYGISVMGLFIWRYGWLEIDSRILNSSSIFSSSEIPNIEYFNNIFEKCKEKYNLDNLVDKEIIPIDYR